MPNRTPLHDLEADRGAVFVEEAGWLVPAHFGDAAEEYQQACRHAALFDLSHHGKLELTGKDAQTFLHNLCTNDVNALPVGAGCEAFLTTGQAKIVGHAFIDHLRLPDGRDAFWLEVAPGMAEKVLSHLDRHLISEQVELADRTRAYAELHLAGPQARQALMKAAGELPDLGLLRHQDNRFAGRASTRIRRNDRLGLPGYDLLCPTDQAGEVWKVLTGAGASPAGLEAFDTLRVEAGTPVYGRDIDENNLPQEVGRDDRAISFTKGCYIGQETVARIRTYGHVNRLLVGLKLGPGGPAAPGAKLFRDNKEVGHVTSSVISPRLGTAVALAYVRRSSHEPRTLLEVETPAGRRAAEVASLPLGGARSETP
jgi:glycine cleavage system T protein